MAAASQSMRARAIRPSMRILPRMKKPAGAKAAAGAVPSIIYARLFTICSPTDQVETVAPSPIAGCRNGLVPPPPSSGGTEEWHLNHLGVKLGPAMGTVINFEDRAVANLRARVAA